MDLWQLLGDLHPQLVHFPLVLLLAGLLFDLAGWVWKSDRAHWAGKLLTIGGTVMLLFGFICGIYAEVWAGRALVPHHQIELHELAANIASWGFVVLCAWRLLMDAARQRWLAAVYTVVGLSWYALLLLTAYLGGLLITDYGASVAGADAATVPSLHDLNTLATRQTPENLMYSEMMHHIFGYLTLGLSGSLLAAALFPGKSDRIRWVGPLLLLLGGIFLFFFADLDLYRLTDPRQWRDREVQLHKTIAIILCVVGFVGLRRSRGSEASRAANVPPKSWAHLQARLIAVMALIGGGMLFTHVHTVAPYANVAAGVYVAHVVMGLVALSIGAASLLGDGFPRQRAMFNVLFAVCMCAESILLITYNEGLPWYIGYGRYNRFGSHGGPIAPYGNVRAEMTFDNETQALSVNVLDRFEDKPAPLAGAPQSIDLLISRGYRETGVTLHRVGQSSSEFSGKAAFLKDVPAFTARLALPVGRNGAMKMGYFDPWVTPVIIPVPPNEVAGFVCPMHEGIRAIEPGTCRLCNMPLVPIDAALRTTLHDPDFDMGFSSTGGDSTSSVILKLTPQRDGQAIMDVAQVHEQRMHLIVVSEDLTFFDHVHPQQQADGSFTHPYAFPADGAYLLFADVTPAGGRSQVFRLPLQMGKTGDARAGAPLTPTAARARVLKDDPTVTVEMISMPRRITAGAHAQLLFRLAEKGQPVNDLRPYLGAMGHCVIISQDTEEFLHCHPEQLFTPRPDARGGPDVAFHTRFPRAGRYKIWGQFRRGNRTIVADFVVDVADPILPASLMNILIQD